MKFCIDNRGKYTSGVVASGQTSVLSSPDEAAGEQWDHSLWRRFESDYCTVKTDQATVLSNLASQSARLGV